ncbi:serine/threonine-protein kinase [Chloroflexota bacterium]
MADSERPKWSDKEFLKRINRLKEAEKGLREMEPVPDVFDADVESIRSKLKSVSQVNEVERELEALKQKIAGYHASQEETSKAEHKANEALEEAAAAIGEAKSAGWAVPRAEEMVAKAREVLDRKDYHLATEYATKATELAVGTRKMAGQAAEALIAAAGVVEEAKSAGFTVTEAEKLLSQAREELGSKDYKSVAESATKAAEAAAQAKEAAKQAKEAIDAAVAAIEEAKSAGFTVTEAEKLLSQAREELGSKDYKSAAESATKAAEAAAQAREAAKQAAEAIDAAVAAIEEARSAGYAISEPEELLMQARTALEKEDYQPAAQYAERAAESAVGLRQTAKPQVIVELEVQDYRPGEWKAVDLGVVNQGKAHAQAVELQFSPEVEVKWLTSITRLDAGNREVLKVGLKPMDAGDIPLDVEVRYRDITDKEYAGAQRFWLEVGRRAEPAREVAGAPEEGKTVTGIPAEIAGLPQLEGYSLERKIGSGGFADVYLGRSNDGLTVAVKIPRLSQYETIESKDFMGEAELWSRLGKQKLPYIVELYECGAVPYPWIAMEYMAGGSLRERMGSLAWRDALDIAMKLMQALHSAHHHGVIHRDIKPENVLFHNQDTPKLTDWGLGKVLLDASMSSIGFKGTIAYSAPEQLAGSRFGVVDWRTDIYQMGMLVYEMLTGQLPFAGLEPGTVIPRILTEEPLPPSKVNTGIPAGLDAPVLRALAKGKEDRFQTMDAFKDRLEEALKGL